MLRASAALGPAPDSSLHRSPRNWESCPHTLQIRPRLLALIQLETSPNSPPSIYHKFAGCMDILTNPLLRPLLETVRSSRNGIVYGGKIRFSHALVINLLYRSGPLKPRLLQVLKATKEHSMVLAAFAIIYKTVVNILKSDQILGDKPGLNKFAAGAVAGWVVYSQHFGHFNPGITHQVTLYCFSRVLIASGKILLDLYLQYHQPVISSRAGLVHFNELTPNQARSLRVKIYNKTWKYFAVLTWALVMFIYDYRPQYLQSSLRHSMAYIYDVEMDTWATWRQFFGIP